jgi:copper homeostasis protein
MKPLVIVPGSGIGPTTVVHILDALLPVGLRELHLSGGRWIDGGMIFRREGMTMGGGGPGEWGVWQTDANVIAQVRRLIDEHTTTRSAARDSTDESG